MPAVPEAQQATLGAASGVLEHSNRAGSATPPAAGAIPPQPDLNGQRQLSAAIHSATLPLHSDATNAHCVANAAAAAAPTGGATIGATSAASQGPAGSDLPQQPAAAPTTMLQERLPPPGLPHPPALLHAAAPDGTSTAPTPLTDSPMHDAPAAPPAATPPPLVTRQLVAAMVQHIEAPIPTPGAPDSLMHDAAATTATNNHLAPPTHSAQLLVTDKTVASSVNSPARVLVVYTRVHAPNQQFSRFGLGGWNDAFKRAATTVDSRR